MKNLLKASLFALLLILIAGQASAQYSLSSDGKDFWVGYMYPSYNKVANASTDGFYGAYVLVSSYTDNFIQLSYFDKTSGVEMPAGRYKVLARTGIQIPLNIQAVKMNDTGEIPEFTACHVTADRPINIEYFSTGACSGGSFLPLPTAGLGKKYVVASYNDNPGAGGLLGGNLGPSELEMSHGFFEIVAPFDGTVVSIIPNATTMRGHLGASSGKGSTGIPHSFTVALSRGQCYLVKAGGDNNSVDISGSIVESNKPIAVLGGHENAFLGGVSGRNLEGRDFMIEQMIPVDQWDTAGYISLPLADSQPADPATYQGVGENYRTYTWDTLGSKVEMSDACTGIFTMPTARLSNTATEQQGITCPVDFKSTNSKKFSVMMYDQRNFATTAPYPAPSMMTIIPMSHWKTSYLWYVPANKFETLQAYFVNVIAPTGDFDNGIKASFNGGAIKPIKSILSLTRQWKVLPNHPGFSGVQFKLSPGSYYATGPHPFIVYNFGFRGIDPDFNLGDFDGDDFFFSYAAPAGMKFGNGSAAHISVKIDTLCSFWNVCIHDSTFGQPNQSIKSITLLNDPTQDIVQTSPRPAKVFYNTRLDDSLDPGYPSFNTNEINFPNGDTDICFKVSVNKPTDSAYAPLFIVDEQGNALIVDLFYKPPFVSLSPDSGRYLLATIGKDTCQRFVFSNFGQIVISNDTTIVFNNITHKNDTTINVNVVHHIGRSFAISSANLKNHNANFQVTSTVPQLPANIKPGDSLVITACFSAKDSTIQKDTILLVTDCFTDPISLLGQGAAPLILSGNRDFGNVLVDSTKCDTVSVRNVGDADFTLTKNWTLSNTKNFSFRDSSLLPIVLKPGQVMYFTFCYTPHQENLDTTVMNWGTNLTDPYKHSIKDSSILRGRGVKSGYFWDRTVQQFTIDTTSGIDSDIVRVHLYNNATGNGSPSAHVDSVVIVGPDSLEFYMLRNQLGYTPLGNFDLKPDDSIWVDIAFKPNLNKPIPQKYADRHAQLVAINKALERDQVIDLTGVMAGKSGVAVSSQPSLFTISPNPASGNSVIITLTTVQETKAILSVYDILGREVFRKDIMQGISMAEIPLRNMNPGVYYVRFTSNNGIFTQKFEVVK